jgi:excisionase family DNA binding protein
LDKIKLGGLEMTELLNLREGAKELKLSIHTLRAWAYQKRIPIVRLGRRVLLRREDLEAFIKKNLIEAKENI